MDIPEHLRGMVDELGEALVAALVGDPRSRELAEALQRAGFELTLTLEASPTAPETPSEAPWSAEDEALLKTFRISLE